MNAIGGYQQKHKEECKSSSTLKLRFTPSGINFNSIKQYSSDPPKTVLKSTVLKSIQQEASNKDEEISISKKKTKLKKKKKKKNKNKRLILRRFEPSLFGSIPSTKSLNSYDAVSKTNSVNKIPLAITENKIENIHEYAEKFYKLERYQQNEESDGLDEDRCSNVLVLNLLSIQRPFNGEPSIEPYSYSQTPSIYNELLKAVHYAYPFLNMIRKSSELSDLCSDPEKYHDILFEIAYTICYPYSMLTIDERIDHWNLERSIRDDLSPSATSNKIDEMDNFSLDPEI